MVRGRHYARAVFGLKPLPRIQPHGDMEGDLITFVRAKEERKTFQWLSAFFDQARGQNQAKVENPVSWRHSQADLTFQRSEDGQNLIS